MKYTTNDSEFDFPAWDGLPKVVFLLASTPRSGSNMLVRGLWQTGIAGAPEEYLTRDFMLDFLDRFGSVRPDLSNKRAWSDGLKVPTCSLQEYVDRLFQIRTSPNGVFGLKLHASHFSLDHLMSHDLSEVIPAKKIVRIRRRDMIRQAISLIVASETDQWIDDPEWKSISKPKLKESSSISFDRQRIDSYIEYLGELEEFLDVELSRWGSEILEVFYEDLCSDYRREINGVLGFLGLKYSGEIPPVNIKRQTDSTKDDWYRLYFK